MTKGYIFRRKVLLASFLFVFWIILTATLAAYELILGAICSALVATISFSVLAYTLDPRITPAVILRFPFFSLALAVEIIKANIDVALIIINPKLPIDPRIIEYRTYLPDDLPKVIFADSITLTPGTVTVELEEEKLFVHCLAAHHEDGLREGTLERLVAWLFGVKKNG